MPETPKWLLPYPTIDEAPAGPYSFQELAEATEEALDKVGAPPSGIFRKNALQNAAPVVNDWSNITWQLEDHKVAGLVHNANAAAVTVPTAGIYEIKAKLGVNSPGLVIGVMIQINGNDLTYTIDSASSASGAFDKTSTNHDLKLSAGDVVTIRGRVNSASTAFDSATCSFSISRKVSL